MRLNFLSVYPSQEAAWQLRSMARQTKRRWRIEPDAHYPAKLQAWLDRVDALVTDINTNAPAQLDIPE